MADAARPTGPGSCRPQPARPPRCSTASMTISTRHRASVIMPASKGAGPGSSVGPALAREEGVVEVDALVLQARPCEQPDGFAHHLLRARDVRLAGGVRQVARGSPADIPRHPPEGGVVRGHRPQLEAVVGALKPPQVLEVIEFGTAPRTV